MIAVAVIPTVTAVNVHFLDELYHLGYILLGQNSRMKYSIVKRSRTRHGNTMLRIAEAIISALKTCAVCMLKASIWFRRNSYLNREYVAAHYR